MSNDLDIIAGGSKPMALSEAVAWLEQEADRIIRASVRSMQDGTAAFPPQVGIGYEAFWLRDYAYTVEGSEQSFSDRELVEACRCFVRAIREDGAGVDCVKFDGTPIYKPGYGSMGENPVADGSQFTVGVAWHAWRRTRDAQLLDEVIDPLVKTLRAVPLNPETHLVRIDPGRPWDRCPYGFTDTTRKTGDVLFDSLLYVQACRQLAELLHEGGRSEEAWQWEEAGRQCTVNISKTFWDPQAGLFRAATVKCREHDLWGSAFAVWLGVADDDQSAAVAAYLQGPVCGDRAARSAPAPAGRRVLGAGVRARHLPERRLLGDPHRMVRLHAGPG